MRLAPVQIAYHVPDPAAAAREYAHRHGWGPFFLMEHIRLTRAVYRGRPIDFDHTSAYGQAGDVMVELIAQPGAAPSPLRDLFGPEESGLHHVACFVDDVDAEVARLEAVGYPVALSATTATGVDFVMVDASADLGHMIELYEPGEALARFYAFVRRAAAHWDGSEPVRPL
jgi:catechol 2,3-dioxygenase-like lactoylglutathione lyase family enzyme